MKLFYGSSEGMADVPSDSPIEASLETALAIFRGLDSLRGFMGVVLDERHVLQLNGRKQQSVRVELLDTSIPAFDTSDTTVEFAESLIAAAAVRQDVFKIAHDSDYHWDHLNMS